MDVSAYTDLVVPAIKSRYPDLQNTRVTEVAENLFSGSIVVVRSDNKVDHEEIVFVSPSHQVKLFSTTEELAYFLHEQCNRSWFDKLFSKPILSGVVFLGLLVVLSLLALPGEKPYNQTVISTLGSVVSLAAGYFFGTSQTGHK